MFSVAATSIGVRPTVNVRNAGKVRCRAAASAAVAPASIGSMTGFRRAGVVDGLGVSRSGASFHSTVARQTLAGGRVGKKFVVKAMFEVRARDDVLPSLRDDRAFRDRTACNLRGIRVSGRSGHRTHRPAAAIRVGGLAAARPRASPGRSLGREKPDSRTSRACRGRRVFLPDPSSPLPSTDAAFHRESHQGRDARAGRGSPPRPQLRRHRAGTRTRLPPLPSRTPVGRWRATSASFLGQALWVVLPLGPPSASRLALTPPPNSSNRSCSASSAKAPASPPRCSSPWVRLLAPPADDPPFPNVSRAHATENPSRCLIHCRGA